MKSEVVFSAMEHGVMIAEKHGAAAEETGIGRHGEDFDIAGGLNFVEFCSGKFSADQLEEVGFCE